jgi:hypothetical protein
VVITGADLGVSRGSTKPDVSPGVGGGPGSNTIPFIGAGGWTPGAGPGCEGGGAATFRGPSAGRSGAGECWARRTAVSASAERIESANASRARRTP